MLCGICRSIEFYEIGDIDGGEEYALDSDDIAFAQFRNAGHTKYRYCVHQPNFEVLSKSANAGCHFCAALYYAFKEPPEFWLQQPIDIDTAASSKPIILAIWRSPEAQYAWPSWRDIPEHEPIQAFCGAYRIEMRRVRRPAGEYVNFSHELETLWAQQTLLQVDSTTASEIAMRLAALWLSQCCESHQTCHVKGAQGGLPQLPTRVIDVKQEGTNPSLYVPRTSKAADYVVLSHCWGPTKAMNTGIKRNPETLEGQASTSDLEFTLPLLSEWPKSFQHAVEIVRALKLRYLWIDNTGIVQGDEVDWASESQEMARYFGNATLVIAATAASSDDEGIFRSRNPLLSRPLCLAPISQDDHGSREELYVHMSGPSNNYDSDESTFTPLQSRAWVLQEELLPRRLLRFGARGIYWQCFSTRTASEPDPTGRPVEPYNHNIYRDRLPMPIHLRLEDHNMTGQGHRNPYYDMWYQLIERFTQRNMKFKKDVLPAIAGLAQTFASFMEDSYVAGLWEADLTLGLLWTAETIGRGRRELPIMVDNFIPNNFSGPTWSWIFCCNKAINLRFDYKIRPGGVYSYLHNEDAVGTRISHVEVFLMHATQTFGGILGASLHVKAKLGSLKIDTRPYTLTQAEKEKRSFVNGAAVQTHVRALVMDETCFPKMREPIKGDCDLDDPQNALYLQSIRDGYVAAAFLPLIMYDNDGIDLPTRLVGLALLASSDQKNEYVRIGRAAVDVDRWDFAECTLGVREIVVI